MFGCDRVRDDCGSGPRRGEGVELRTDGVAGGKEGFEVRANGIDDIVFDGRNVGLNRC